MDKVTYTNTENEKIILTTEKPFILSEKEGFASVDNIIESSKIYNQDGEIFVSQSLAVRNIGMSGMLMADDKDQLSDYRLKMISVFNPKIAGSIIYENGNGKYSIDVIPEFPPTFKENELIGIQNVKPYSLTLKALDPYWRDTSIYDSLIPLSKVENKFRFPLIISDEFVFASMISGEIISVNNHGSVEVGSVFRMKIKGDVTNPRIYNVLTQEYFGFNGTYANGTEFVISTLRGKKKVEKTIDGITTNAMSERMSGSSFLQLKKGENHFQLQADNDVNLVIGELNFTPLVLGV